MAMIEVREYATADGHSPFADWLTALRDSRAKQAIVARMVRLQSGLRGDWKAVGAGVFELRIDTGPGYRVYCGQDGATLVLLLCAGDKRSQSKDIEHAHDYWNDYQTRR
jgi:putative addiction module killer protein